MKADLPAIVKQVLQKLEKAGFESYIVGGAVRDLLTGRGVDDWDFTTNAKPEEILKIFPKGVYDNAFGTVMLPNELTESPFDITTYRTEHGYSDTRRPDKVKWGKSLEEDLKRRDFTINAMALKLEQESKTRLPDGQGVKEQDKNKPKKTPALLSRSFLLIDPYGGQKDLKSKVVRAVGDPNLRFSEDALRMMRAIRIASELGFQIEEKTFEAIKNNSSLINKIAKERVRDELLKILGSPYPYEGIVMFKNSLLMNEIIPELEKTFGVEQKSPGRHHIYDVGTHSLLSLKYVSEKNSDPIVRFATLIHDVGKAYTYKKLPNGVITFYNHELVSGKVAKRIAQRLKFSKNHEDKFYKLVRYHQFTVDEKQTDSAIRRFIRNVGIENVSDMLDLRVGDRLGGGARETSWRLEEYKERLIEVQKQPFTVHDLKISGNDVMKELDLKPGPKVGEILDKLYKDVVDKKVENEKKPLLEKLNSYK